MNKFKIYITQRLRPVIACEYREKIDKHKVTSKCVKLVYMIMLFIKNMPKVMEVICNKKLAISYMELVSTTRCSLRCRYCSNLIQYYNHDNKKAYDSDLQTNVRAVKNLLRVVNTINEFCVLGGEPLLYGKLYELLAFLDSCAQIKTITITTNGTITIADDNILELLKKEKFCVRISNYGQVSKNISLLKEQLEDNRIKFIEVFADDDWIDCGDMHKRDRSAEELKLQYKRCGTSCRSLINGELHTCFRSSHGMDLGLIPKTQSEFVDLLDEGLTEAELYKAVKRVIFQREYVEACDYCDLGIMPVKYVPPGLQMKG
ncbi:MAG: radical SAM protein [Muribaculaceae bacterium]|nr:radical SAM protein [Muribaculaceae bacterium]